MNRLRAWLAAGGESWEGRTQVAIMLAMGGAGAAMSWSHVHDVAAAHGQPGWKAWADAITLELAAIACGLEMRHRRRRGQPVWGPALVLAAAVALSVAAQLVQAERSFVGWLAAAVPCLFFLAMAKFALGRIPAPAMEQAAIPVATPAVPAVATPPPAASPPVVATPVARPVRTVKQVATASGHADAAAKVAALLATEPAISDSALADRTGLARTTARRHRAKLQPGRVNGNVPDLTSV